MKETAAALTIVLIAILWMTLPLASDPLRLNAIHFRINCFIGMGSYRGPAINYGYNSVIPATCSFVKEADAGEACKRSDVPSLRTTRIASSLDIGEDCMGCKKLCSECTNGDTADIMNPRRRCKEFQRVDVKKS